MINKIIEVIQDMVKVHQALNTLAVQKTEVVKTGDIQTLNKMINQEEALTQRLSQLEDTRQQLVIDEFGETHNIASFSDLIEVAPEETKPVLQDLQQQLATEVFALKQRNDLNQQLIKQSLEWVELNLNLLDPGTKKPTYSRPNGHKNQPTAARSRFDSKA